jgi:hypothetical protein
MVPTRILDSKGVHRSLFDRPFFFFTYPIEIYAAYRVLPERPSGEQTTVFTLQIILLKGFQPPAIGGQFVPVAEMRDNSPSHHQSKRERELERENCK